MSVEGECYCGAVRYRVDGALVLASACHCSRCRKCPPPCQHLALASRS